MPIENALYKFITIDRILQIASQPHSQDLSSLPLLVVGTETPVAAGHVTTQTLGGRKICWMGGATGWYFIVLSTKCT